MLAVVFDNYNVIKVLFVINVCLYGIGNNTTNADIVCGDSGAVVMYGCSNGI